ncbi:hypothetical protein AOQ73_28090 [Bradyrhizobium pachyrhizi]|nr:hypothetical protein AOQ73_28090 [Bradyrhizobium pachyrhizi]
MVSNKTGGWSAPQEQAQHRGHWSHQYLIAPVEEPSTVMVKTGDVEGFRCEERPNESEVVVLMPRLMPIDQTCPRRRPGW